MELQRALDAQNFEQMRVQEEMEKLRAREQELEGRLSELGLQASELRSSLSKKDAEVASARLEGEQKASEHHAALRVALRQ
eukprot:4750060-Heterocapsa_arctica.AAC.1